MNEEWRQIPGFPDHEASSMGRLRRNDYRVTRTFHNGRLVEERTHHKTVYLAPRHQTTITAPDGIHSMQGDVARFVALTFLGPIAGCVVHLNGDVNDNRAENLAYVSHRDVRRHYSGIRHTKLKQSHDQKGDSAILHNQSLTTEAE